MIDTADTVKHKPTGETWLVAMVKNDRLYWCGYPLGGSADLADCELLEGADESSRLKLLQKLSDCGEHQISWYAKSRLDKG